MKILILESNPRKDLNLDQEINSLKKVLEQSINRQDLKVEVKRAVRPEDLQGLLLKHKPHIVHFCGHGTGQGLVLQDDTQREKLVSKDALSNLFELCSQWVNCVLLNTCYSEEQANAIVQHIDYVIGMKHEIGDDAAINFTKGFYQALGYGHSIEQSYKFGCNAIHLNISHDSHVRSTLSQKKRILLAERTVERVAIPEHLKPVLKNNPNLVSNADRSKNVNFSELRKYLEQEDWKLADLETKDIILKAAGLNFNEKMSPEAINNLPHEVLKMIDELWVNSSNGHFGFSTQIKIYKTLCRDQLEWSKKVGWRNSDLLELFRKQTRRSIFGWIPYQSLNFSLQAKKGHLPALGKHGYGANGRVDLIQVIENKMAKC